MKTNKSTYGNNLDYGLNANINTLVNKETISRYLLNGSYAKPGTKHFLKGFKYNNIQSFDVSRMGVSSLDDIEDYLRKNVRKILKKEKKISLLLTSGLDSYLLYLILKSESNGFKSNNQISFLTGRFDSPYDEYEVLKSKNNNIEIDKKCHKITSPIEMIQLLRQAVIASNQPVNGLVASAVFKAISLAIQKNSIPVLGTGETIFFTSSFNFIKEVNQSETRNYSADKTIQTLCDYLTDEGLRLAQKGQQDLIKNDKKIFDYSGELEEFIHNQQFYIDAPRVDYEVSSYCKFFNFKALTPLRDQKLLELFIRLPSNEQHDGNPKTVIRNLIKRIEDSDDYVDGPNLKMTSPQRECLRNSFKDGGFSELVKYYIENSRLSEMNIVDKDKINLAYKKYVNDYDEAFNNNSFRELSSYNIWKFFITEFWLDIIAGNKIDVREFL